MNSDSNSDGAAAVTPGLCKLIALPDGSAVRADAIESILVLDATSLVLPRVAVITRSGAGTRIDYADIEAARAAAAELTAAVNAEVDAARLSANGVVLCGSRSPKSFASQLRYRSIQQMGGLSIRDAVKVVQKAMMEVAETIPEVSPAEVGAVELTKPLPDWLQPLPKGYVLLGWTGTFEAGGKIFKGLIASEDKPEWFVRSHLSGLVENKIYAAAADSDIARLNGLAPAAAPAN